VPKWRTFTWVILAINLLFLVGVLTIPAWAGTCGTLTEETCDVATTQLLGALWVAADVVMGAIWLITRRRSG
jgi:hypothetical protein